MELYHLAKVTDLKRQTLGVDLAAARLSYAGERHEPASEQHKRRGSGTSVAKVAKLCVPANDPIVQVEPPRVWSAVSEVCRSHRLRRRLP
jgi:hypothetical protein